MSENPNQPDAVEISDEEGTDVEELSDEGVGATVTEGEPNTFEPEEDAKA